MAVLKTKIGFPGLTGSVAVVNFCNEKFVKSESAFTSDGVLLEFPCHTIPDVSVAAAISTTRGAPVIGLIKASLKLGFFMY